MEQALWFSAGLLTIPAVWLLLLFWVWLTDKNLEIECHRCGRCFGQIGETYVRVTRQRFRWHRWAGDCKHKAAA